MTTAAPLLLAEQDDFPDLEAVVMDMLSVVEVNGTPVGDNSGTRTPADVSEPYFHVFRQLAAGGMNAGSWSDTAYVYVAAWSATREQSRQMIRGARHVFAQYDEGGEHKGVLLDRVWESSAPGPLPTQDEDDRRIELGIGVRVRRHHRASVYA